MDNYGLWEQHEARLERETSKYPICDGCGEHITDEYIYEIDGDLYCENCIEDFRKPIERFMED